MVDENLLCAQLASNRVTTLYGSFTLSPRRFSSAISLKNLEKSKNADTRLMMQKFRSLLLICCVLTSCGQSQFQTSPPLSRPSKKNVTNENVGGKQSANSSGEGVALGQQLKEVTLSLSPQSTPNDVLFVFDNSVSMDAYIANVRRGFESLGSADWVSDTRIAVMTTMPGTPGNLSQPHPGIARYTGIEREPGFLSFVSSSQVALFQRVASSPESGAYPEALCAQEWFSPTSTNISGRRCLSVALQNPYFATVCEAGMTAVSQLIDKKGKVFRDGAFAQIVFISDAQDPGCQNQSLINLRPTPAALQSKIKSVNNIQGLRFHGAVPVPGGGSTKEIAREGTFNYPYNQLVTETKGALVDITRSTDYSGFAQSLAKSNADPVLTLPEAATRIESVRVAGNPLDASQWRLSVDGLKITLTDVLVNAKKEVVVRYSKK